MQLQNHQYLRTGLTKDEEWIVTRLLLNNDSIRFVDLLNDWHREYGNFSATALLRLISFIEGPGNILEKVTHENTLYISLSELGKFYHLDNEEQLYLNYPIYLHIDRAYLTENYTYNKNIGISYAWVMNEYGLLAETFENSTPSKSLFPAHYSIENRIEVEQLLITKGYANYTLTLPYTYVKSLERLELLTPGKYNTKPLKHFLYGITEHFLIEHLERLGHFHLVESSYIYLTDAPRAYNLHEILQATCFSLENITSSERKMLEDLYAAELALAEQHLTITHDTSDYFVQLDYMKNSLKIVNGIQFTKNNVETSLNMLTYKIRNPLDEWTIVTNNTHVKVTLSSLEQKASKLHKQGIKLNGVFPYPNYLLTQVNMTHDFTDSIDDFTLEKDYTPLLKTSLSPVSHTRSNLALFAEEPLLSFPASSIFDTTYYFVNPNGTVKVCSLDALYTRNSIVKSTIIPATTELVDVHCIETDATKVKYLLLITKNGYIKAVPSFEFKSKHRASKYVRGIRLDYDDKVIYSALLHELPQLQILVNGIHHTYDLSHIVSTKMNKGRFSGESDIKSISIVNKEILADIL